MALLRYIDIFDLHYGWERVQRVGEWITQTTHNDDAVAAMMEFAHDLKPHIVLLGGDQLNAGPISHWRKGKPILTEGLRLKDEMDLLDEKILRPFDALIPKPYRGGRKIWLDGNHENWIDDHVNENPSLAGMVEPRNYLRLKRRGWEIYSPGEMAWIGKLAYIHGDKFFRNHSGIGPREPATKLVNAYHRNIRCGHLHTWSVATEVTPADAFDYHTGIVRPAMCKVNQGYGFNTPTNAMNGFGCGYVDPETGDFSDQTIIINKNRFTVGGKTYGR